jgi:hypothetical protein
LHFHYIFLGIVLILNRSRKDIIHAVALDHPNRLTKRDQKRSILVTIIFFEQFTFTHFFPEVRSIRKAMISIIHREEIMNGTVEKIITIIEKIMDTIIMTRKVSIANITEVIGLETKEDKCFRNYTLLCM